MPQPWKIIDKRLIYDSDWIRLHHLDLSMPDGQIARNWHLIDYPRAAAGILPIGDDGRILMIDHWRFTTQQRHWETPGGAIDAGETPIEAAHRELLEETGHAARNIEQLCTYLPAYGSANLHFHVYLATGVHRVGELTDTNEIIALKWFTPDEVRGMLDRNEIADGMTLTGLLWYFLRRAENDKRLM